MTVALASWVARPDKVMHLNRGGVVTSGFVDRWHSTAISRFLREDNYEHDFFITPSNGGFPDGVSYRWIDDETTYVHSSGLVHE